nr:immunoglobulin heavy chain junction region [Mus musculus]MBK4196057.1 immunoglobulin heavy chain junction region [Mus musculus]
CARSELAYWYFDVW